MGSPWRDPRRPFRRAPSLEPDSDDDRTMAMWDATTATTECTARAVWARPGSLTSAILPWRMPKSIVLVRLIEKQKGEAIAGTPYDS